MRDLSDTPQQNNPESSTLNTTTQPDLPPQNPTPPTNQEAPTLSTKQAVPNQSIHQPNNPETSAPSTPIPSDPISVQKQSIETTTDQSTHKNQVPPPRSKKPLIGVLFIIVLMGLGAYFFLPQNSIHIKDQPPGDYFHIDRAQVKEDSVLVIIEADPLGSSDGGIVVAMTEKILKKGVYTDFDIPFSPLGDIDTRLESGKSYYAVLRKLDFRISTDEHELTSELKNLIGKPAQVRFKLI